MPKALQLLGYVHTMADSFSCWHEKISDFVVSMNTYPILDFPHKRLVRCSVVPLQKSRRRKSYTVLFEHSLTSGPGACQIFSVLIYVGVWSIFLGQKLGQPGGVPHAW